MAYKVKQYNYFSNMSCDNFMTPITAGIHYYPACGIDNGVTGGSSSSKKDDAVKLVNQKMNADKSYYFHGEIKRTSDVQTFVIKLVNLDDSGQVLDEKTSQIVKRITVAGSQSNNEWASVEFTFSPFASFNAILFHPETRSSKPVILYEELSEINNLVDIGAINTNSILQLGIQATPGTAFVINGNSIKVNPNGTFELMKDLIIVNFIQCVVGAYFKNKTELNNAKSQNKSAILFANEKIREINDFSITYMYQE